MVRSDASWATIEYVSHTSDGTTIASTSLSRIGNSTGYAKPAKCSPTIRTRAKSRDDLARGLRFFPVDNYLVFYTVRNDGITV